MSEAINRDPRDSLTPAGEPGVPLATIQELARHCVTGVD
jgi:hypothetical protein